VLLGLPAHHLDHEEPGARRERLQVIADAVSEASLRATCTETYWTQDCRPIWPLLALDLGVLLVTQAYSESRLARNVHEGRCRAYECDPIRSARTGLVEHRARSLWQIHRILPIESEWDRMQGSDLQSTTAAAWAATKLLSRGYRACGSISGAISRYAGIDGCQWTEAQNRARIFANLRQRAAKFAGNGKVQAQRPSRTAAQTSMR
jgi:hypothetical protein